MYPYRVFTIDEANNAVPEVARVTEEVQERLDEIRSRYVEGDAGAGDRLQSEIQALLSAWQDAILELGGEPKGIFTVDFRSPDPNVLWCWTVDDAEITHRHFTWESFKDRVSVEGDGQSWPGEN